MRRSLVLGDCFEVMPRLPANSFDAGITDPPYGIGFMGKEWDTFKPGVGQAERHRNPSGKPPVKIVSDNPNVNGRVRSPAISPSQIEYDMSVGGQRRFQAWNEIWAREVYRVLKPGAHLLVCGAPRSYHRMVCGVEDAGFEIRDCLMWVFGQGFPKSENLDGEWDGWGTGLKPAWEPILVARKPLVGTVRSNMNVYRTGAIDIDRCRVPIDDIVYARNCSGDRGHAGTRSTASRGATDFRQGRGLPAAGRWPANLIHDGSEEVVAAFPNAVGQIAGPSNRSGRRRTQNVYGGLKGGNDASIPRGDGGSAARFFYCAKTSRTDRNEGCANLDSLPLRWSDGDQNPGSFQSANTERAARNFHPTVKPTALMQWLVRLVTPPGGTVLDPFGGSGSTAKGCIYEGRKYLLIEREPAYMRIIRARVGFAMQKFASIA